MQENILDEKEEEEIVGISPQPLVSVARVVLCMYMFYLIFEKTINTSYAHWQLREWLFFLIFILLKGGFMIYYNVIHAIEESRGTAVKPKFSRALVGFFMVLLGMMGLGFIRGFIIYLDYDFFAPLAWFSLILTACTIVILIRENKYYYWWKRQK